MVIKKKLVSGTNIKTVGGQTLLGSGNISLPTIPTFKTINGENLTGSGDITIKGSNPVVDSNGFSIYGTRMVANPLSNLEGLTVHCMGDSITQGTSLGDPTTEKSNRC